MVIHVSVGMKQAYGFGEKGQALDLYMIPHQLKWLQGREKKAEFGILTQYRTAHREEL